MIDALLQVVAAQTSTGDLVLDTAIDRASSEGRPILLVTAHRRESWGEPMASIGRAIAELARIRSDLLVVIPVHRNPVVRDQLLPPSAGLSNVLISEPLDYAAFTYLMSRSQLILTDSGGPQEEAPTLMVPVLIARDTTERQEAIDCGAARLVGTDTATIVNTVLALLADQAAYDRMASAGNPFGDGLATAERSGRGDHAHAGPRRASQRVRLIRTLNGQSPRRAHERGT